MRQAHERRARPESSQMEAAACSGGAGRTQRGGDGEQRPESSQMAAASEKQPSRSDSDGKG